MKILVTGGAGFIGSHLVDRLVAGGHDVRVFDNLDGPAHPESGIPRYLNKNAQFIKGDVRDYDGFKKALEGIDVVFHEAAAVGLAQSLYEIKRYVDVNIGGTANLLNILANEKNRVKKLVIPGSMSSYGEGGYRCGNCGDIRPSPRSEDLLRRGVWEIPCPHCAGSLSPRPVRETDALNGTFIYSCTKRSQEEMSLIFGNTYHVPVTVLRYFSAFGPRQSLSNPYTGVAVIFLSRIMNRHPPVIYEDGLQMRDYLSVHDIVSANIAALEDSRSDGQIFNVGSGRPVRILDIAGEIIRASKSDLRPQVLGQARKGDIRHCYADISHIKQRIGWEPKVSFEEGLRELLEWSRGQEAVDKFDHANDELRTRGLL
ncbi:MAG: SDR family NAD(P)-dependent oxidoreductase [Candidatus Omnitrophica bacterium]|nr:SDR family NAD(P)-dependent oxidoreductase [Candidatus Omnitrophota bacterium]MDE2223623.1 SDR family NAD(P)-dependent oxidoreductase [Candidatus Omnitrophota bacterium]